MDMAVILAFRYWSHCYGVMNVALASVAGLNPTVLRCPRPGPGTGIVLLFYSIGAFFSVVSVYLRDALHFKRPERGPDFFLPFGVGFLIGPTEPFPETFCRKLSGAIGMGCRTSGLAGPQG